MQRTHMRWAKTLTFMGSLPFMGAILSPWIGIDHLHSHYFVLTYGAVIISFLSGIHWGLFMAHAHDTRLNLLITSNVFALLAWGSLLLLQPLLAVSVQIVCFLVLWLIDKRLVAEAVIRPWFFRLRTQITAIVLFCLCVEAMWQWRLSV